MKRLRGVFMVAFVVCWLTVVGQQGVLSSADFHSLAGSDQTSAPADNDDPSDDDGTLADDVTIQSRRNELAVPLQSVLRSTPPAPHPRARRETAALALLPKWQFIQRAAAAPRAPCAIG
jgi:hypothetical protein